MTLSVELDAPTDVKGIDVMLVASLLESVATSEFTPTGGQWTLYVRLTDDPDISALHLTYFGDPSATDVITFPLDEFGTTGGHLGDVVISTDTARVQAGDAGHSVQREVGFLALHGLLHLCGHRDDTAASRNAMLELQEALLREFEAAHGICL